MASIKCLIYLTHPLGADEDLRTLNQAYLMKLKLLLLLGIIGAAFTSNAQTLPAADAAMQAILNPTINAGCATTLAPKVVIRNAGTTIISTVRIGYRVDGGSVFSYNQSVNLAPTDSDTFTLANFNALPGNHVFRAFTAVPNGRADNNNANDTLVMNFTIFNNMGNPLPLTQGFEGFTLPPAGWQLINENLGSPTWVRTLNAKYTGFASAFKNCFSDQNTGQEDHLVTPFLNFSDSTKAYYAAFHVAHAQYNNDFIDELQVSVSTDCGATWTVEYAKQSPQLSTAPAQTTSFTPGGTGQWRRDSIDLSAYRGKPSVRLRFTTINGSGNNIYLDNILVQSLLVQPQASFSLGADTFCRNEPISLSNSSAYAGSFLWTMPGATPNVSNMASPTVSYNDTGSYIITLTAVNGLGLSSTSKTVYIAPGVTPTVIQFGLLLSTSQPYLSYQWLRNGVVIPGATSMVYEVIKDGEYSVSVTDSTAICPGTSAPRNVSVLAIGSTSFKEDGISISPNPAKGFFSVDSKLGGASTALSILNSVGKEVMHTPILNGSRQQIDISALTSGVYLLRFSNGSSVVNKRLMVTN